LAVNGIITWVNLNEERWVKEISIWALGEWYRVKGGKESGMVLSGERVPVILIRRR
jgi:hypothetical protein